ncbi:MAG: aminoacyl-tRNA hydrolase [Alphaproteobacteria bacterium RIFOXYD12_FULL_60_8]|nr:MAG: aminoacyl-tRNA hydrolase [Alphaproteobacteria bacterium RIFOXYD12_FULL_60_8]
MRLVVGLGNPGKGYANNRHNIGFMAADAIVRRHSFSPWRGKFHGQLAEGTVAGQKLLVLKPETYMNLSGDAVAEAVRFYKLSPEDVIVFHDELDLAPGKVRVKQGGGHAGHNGLRSISAHLGEAYKRVRIGIGHPGHKDRVHDHVLSDFAKADQDWVETLCEAMADALPLLLKGPDSDFMSHVAMKMKAVMPKNQKDMNQEED